MVVVVVVLVVVVIVAVVIVLVVVVVIVVVEQLYMNYFIGHLGGNLSQYNVFVRSLAKHLPLVFQVWAVRLSISSRRTHSCWRPSEYHSLNTRLC